MQGNVSAAWLYLLNATLLITHEIDSAYWEEWDLFHLPGGIESFLALNLLLVALVLYGFWRVTLWRSGAKAASVLLAGAGIAAFAIHLYFLARGSEAFRSAASRGLLLSIFVVSLAQMAVVVRVRAGRSLS